MPNAALTALREEYKNCQRCPILVKNRTQVVFGEGNPKAKIVFIGEAPGANEDREGIPFCGASGKIVNELLASVSLSREDIFITNTIMCRPQDNRNPTTEEVQNCSDRLDQLLAIMQPEVIVTIGNFATERILKKKGITTLRGKVFSTTIGKQTVNVVPIIHPASYLYSGRNPALYKKMQEDFQTIAQTCKERSIQRRLVA